MAREIAAVAVDSRLWLDRRPTGLPASPVRPAAVAVDVPRASRPHASYTQACAHWCYITCICGPHAARSGHMGRGQSRSAPPLGAISGGSPSLRVRPNGGRPVAVPQ
ncbi:hypothetical protein [Oryza sativa Japonica Group]|uniref:Uncharacterized protein n=1 Tax=Oryza sativa subsp. japonica TaxID=39947 RepID=Q94EC9_ORYSJ|nr:hypothetical protein [Oryza sativa Japonica Group]